MFDFLLLLIEIFILTIGGYYLFFFTTQTKIKKIDSSATIGILERLLFFLCFLLNQITLIAVIITVKSFVRFPINDEEKQVSGELYILGTLQSILLAMVLSYIHSYLR